MMQRLIYLLLRQRSKGYTVVLPFIATHNRDRRMHNIDRVAAATAAAANIR